MFKRKNCGTKDRIARVVGGGVIAALLVLDYIQGTVALILGVIALVLMGTGAAGYCALYEPMGIDTREKEE